VVPHEGDGAREGVAQPVARGQLGRGLGGVQHRVARGLEHDAVQAVVRAEVVEEQPAGDPGAPGERRDRQCVERSVGERPHRERDELRAALLGIQPRAFPRHPATVPRPIDSESITGGGSNRAG
jgi:hypothetical protein